MVLENENPVPMKFIDVRCIVGCISELIQKLIWKSNILFLKAKFADKGNLLGLFKKKKFRKQCTNRNLIQKLALAPGIFFALFLNTFQGMDCRFCIYF